MEKAEENDLQMEDVDQDVPRLCRLIKTRLHMSFKVTPRFRIFKTNAPCFFYKTTGFEPRSHILGLVLKFRSVSDELKSVISDELNFNGSSIQLVMILYWLSYIIIINFMYQYNTIYI